MADITPIRVGIIGLSGRRGWAAEAHLPALRALGGRYEVVALSGSNAKRAREAGEVHGIGRCYATAAELVRDPEVDLVTISVKVPLHRDLVRAALEAGKHVYCEWPLARDAGEAADLAALAREKGLRAVVGLQARAAPAIRYVKDLVHDGYVGEVLSTTMVGSGGAWGVITDEANAYLNDNANGATMLSIPFGHSVDALSFVLGEWREAGAVMAVRRPEVTVMPAGRSITKTAPDQIVASGMLESGAIASVHYRGGVSRGTNFLWEINGTKGDLVLTAPTGFAQNTTLSVCGARGKETLAELTVPAGYAFAPDIASGRYYNVGQTYAQLADDFASDGSTAPDFDVAVTRHAFLDGLLRSAGVPTA